MILIHQENWNKIRISKNVPLKHFKIMFKILMAQKSMMLQMDLKMAIMYNKNIQRKKWTISKISMVFKMILKTIK